MKTLEQIKKEYKTTCMDGRDFSRLAIFLSNEDLLDLGLSLAKASENFQPKEFNRDNVLAQLKNDVSFGFEKALDQRGLSASLMFNVVKMWNWILKEGLEDWDDKNYAQYGLPLFKATAMKYGWPNPIEDDVGNESRYSCYNDYYND
jgi:hypothetical protein